MNPDTNTSIIELRKVSMTFPQAPGQPHTVLQDIDLSLRSGEIVGLLGRSGSGKSTLLRIAAGLIKPTAGDVLYRGAALTGPSEGISVVFQTFALYPWLTVLDNVRAGLDALSLPRAEARRRSLEAIRLIGLDGYQSAYPRELSGGMRQRVGFARAQVSEPIMLLMDEPFSALDVLTAESLRSEFLDLWLARQLSTQSVLMVTHNIEEALLMCDRILVLAPNPGHIFAEIPVSLPHPRDRLDPAFREVSEHIYDLMTERLASSDSAQGHPGHGLAQILRNVSSTQIVGLIEKLEPLPSAAGARLTELADKLGLSIGELLPIAEVLHILDFAELKDGCLTLTAGGRAFEQSIAAERKRLFGEHLLRFVPLAAHIHRVLVERDDHQAPRRRFSSELEDHLNRHDAEHMLLMITGWARYAELFAYDDKRRIFSLS
ncbi:MAG: nitrate/sulfonate/bicarbonate ABC transporter ATP-binding protein [Burkholderiales bacterium]